jgi:hypothetical protein
VRVSPNLFSVLLVDPMLGRRFLADEGRPGQTDVVILSYGLWQRQFGSDPAIIGRSIPLDGRNHVVVGVMPPAFDFPTNLQRRRNRRTSESLSFRTPIAAVTTTVWSVD